MGNTDLSSSQQSLVPEEEVKALGIPNDQHPLRKNLDAQREFSEPVPVVKSSEDQQMADSMLTLKKSMEEQAALKAQNADLGRILDQSTSKPVAEPVLTPVIQDLTGALQNMLQLSGYQVDPAKPVLGQYTNFTSALALKQVLYNKIHAITDCEPDTKSIFEMLMKDYMISVASDVEKLSNERLAEQADSAKI